MDTPEKKTLPSSSLLSEFEDSPVFNYIGNLSPITPFNLSRSGQSFHGLVFVSPRCLPTSPLNSCLDESKIKSESPVSGVPKNNCSQNDRVGKLSRTSGAVASATLNNEEVDISDSTEQSIVQEPDESSKRVTELPQCLQYANGNPDHNLVHSGAGKPECGVSVAGTEISSVKVTQGVSQEVNCPSKDEMGVQGIPLEENKQVCNWENFISQEVIYEASDFLNYRTPRKDKHHEEPDDKNVDSGTLSFVATVLQAPNENIDGTHELDSVSPLFSSEDQDVEVPFSQPGMRKPYETSQAAAARACALLAEEVVHYSSTEVGGKSYSQQQQMTRRRCLVYEMSGTHFRKLLSDPVDGSPDSELPANPNRSSERSEAANRPAGNKSSSLLPGIGLHLNALAATSREKIIVKRQTLTCRRQLISSECTTSSCDALTSDARPLSTPLAPDIAGMSNNEQEGGVHVTGNICQNSVYGEGVEFHESSPKKKRLKAENTVETESCKRCNCKRSKCLKLYCECFAAGLYCVEPCNCHDCFNKPIHEETVLETRRQIESRNPLAFAPKVIRSSSTAHNGDDLKTPASARHKRGCNCKKSGCLKKYCECFQGGVGCSLSCRCEGCKNTFGQKEDIAFVETPAFDKRSMNANSHIGISKADTENEDLVTPVPLNIVRPPVRRPFHFGGMASQLPSTLQSCTIQNPDRSDDHILDEDLMITLEEEVPEARDDYSLPTSVKSMSPNSKRVSPPRYGFEPSPGWKTCRKLILKSIPSLPASVPKKEASDLEG